MHCFLRQVCGGTLNVCDPNSLIYAGCHALLAQFWQITCLAVSCRCEAHPMDACPGCDCHPHSALHPQCSWHSLKVCPPSHLCWTIAARSAGTPLQNSIKELWALLHFLDFYKFPCCEQFEAQHSQPLSKTHLTVLPTHLFQCPTHCCWLKHCMYNPCCHILQQMLNAGEP